ncbi:MAG TPA: hypothetical protein DDW52_17860 [Planctomycetaceae bacterium]|nr:hypothetical protein [Planctomycetaceae bacterium]
MHSTNTFDHDDDDSNDDDSFETEPRDGPIGRLEPPREVDSYVIKDEIGRGGMGIVYKAYDRKLNRTVALKILPSAKTSRSSMLRFKNEAKAAAAVSHSNIIPVYNVGDASGTPYYAMKLIEGQDLSQTIKEVKRTRNVVDTDAPADDTKKSTDKDNISISAAEIDAAQSVESPHNSQPDQAHSNTGGDAHGLKSAGSSVSASLAQDRSTREEASEVARTVAKIGKQVASALDCAHASGIVHRDIKPSNLMLDHSGTVWVADFGLASFQDADALTRTGDVVGTLRYMSPEQATGRQVVDERSDIFSLGITLYELATLEHPYSASGRDLRQQISFGQVPPVRRSSPKLPAAFETIVCRATESNPLHRYQSAKQLVNDLEAFLDKGMVRTRRTPKWKYARDWLYRRPLFTATSACLLLIMLAAASVGAVALNRARINTLADQLISLAALAKGPVAAIDALVRSETLRPDPYNGYAVQAQLSKLYELKRFPINPHKPGLLSASADGSIVFIGAPKQFLASQEAGQGCILNRVTGDLRSLPDGDNPLVMGAISSDNRFLVATTFAKQVNVRQDAKFPIPPALWCDLGKKPALRELTGTQLYRTSEQTFAASGKRIVVPSTKQGEAFVYRVGNWKQPEMVLRGQHDAQIVDGIFSPDSQLIATLGMDGQIVLWDATDGTYRHQTQVAMLDRPLYGSFNFSKDSSRLIVQSIAGTRILNAQDLSVVQNFQELGAFSDDMHYFAGIPLMQDELLVYNLLTGAPATKLRDDVIRDATVRFVGDHTLCVASEHRQDILLIDARTAQIIQRLHTRGETVSSTARLSEREFASGIWDNTLSVWSIDSDTQRRSVRLKHPFASQSKAELSKIVNVGKHAVAGPVFGYRSFVLDADNDLNLLDQLKGRVVGALSNGNLIVHETSGKLAIHDHVTLKVLEQTNYDSEFKAVLGNTDRKVFLLSQRGELQVWDLETQSLPKGSITNSIVSDAVVEGNRIYTAQASGQVVSIDTRTSELETIFKAPEPLRWLTVDANRIVAVGQSKTTYLASIQNAKIQTLDFQCDHRLKLNGQHLCFYDATQGKVVVVALQDGKSVAAREIKGLLSIAKYDDEHFLLGSTSSAVLWNFVEDEVVELCDHRASAFIKEGNITVVVGRGANTPYQLTLLDDSQQIIAQKSISDLQYTLTTVRDGKLYVAHLCSGVAVFEGTNVDAPRLEINSRNRIVDFAATASTKATICMVSRNGEVILEELSQHQQTAIGNHDRQLVCSAFSADGKQLITSDRSGATMQWDIAQGKRVREIDFGNRVPESHFISRDGITVVTRTLNDDRDSNEQLAVWDLRSGNPRWIKLSFEPGPVAISDDGKQILVGGKPDRISVSPSAASDYGRPKPLVRVDTTSLKIDPIEFDASVFDLRVVPKTAVLLTSTGRLYTFDFKTNSVRPTKLEQRILSILNTDGNTCYLSTHDSTIGYDIAADRVVSAHPTLASVPFEVDQSPWLLVLTKDKMIRRIPKDPIAYAKDRLTSILGTYE